MEELKHVGLEAAWLESLSGCFKSAEMINPFLVLISVGILMFDQRKEQRTRPVSGLLVECNNYQ